MKYNLGRGKLSRREIDHIVQGSADNPYLSPSFKVWIVGFIFFLVFAHLFTRLAFPDFYIISEKFILGAVLALIGYLWVQELRDKYRLEDVNKALRDAQERLQDAEINTISSLILMVEARDPYLSGHSRRVTDLSLEIAKVIEFSHESLEVVRRAATLHDLGKLVISESIWSKPDKLTDEEWMIVKQHPKIGADILEPLKFLHLERRIVLHHHERMDGNGYPSGLKGRDIPLESRIISVADTFDAMNSDRPYREALSRGVIVEELRKVSDKQLDGALVSIFLNILERDPKLWDRD